MGWIDGRLCYGRMDSQGVEKMNQDIRHRLGEILNEYRHDSICTFSKQSPPTYTRSKKTALDAIEALVTQAEREARIDELKWARDMAEKDITGHTLISLNYVNERLKELAKEEK